jgi:hypothetical protein
MGNLNEIAHRHGRDRLKDAVFIVAAVLLTALSIGSVTTKAAGKPGDRQFDGKVTVVESGLEIGR